MATFPDEPNDDERSEALVDIEGFDREDIDDILPPPPAVAKDIDEDEILDEGEADAIPPREPNAGSAVLGYDPTKDKRRKS